MEDKNQIDLNEISEIGKALLQEDDLLDEASSDLDKRMIAHKQSESKVWKYGAIVLTLSALLYLGYLVSGQSNKAQYAQMEDVPTSLVPIVRSSENESRLIDRAVRSYSSKNYEEASHIFSRLISDGKDSLDFAKLFQSSILAKQKDYAGSVRLLEQIDNNAIKEIVDWHKFLSYQHIDVAKAKQQLQLIVNEKEHYKNKRATQLLLNYN